MKNLATVFVLLFVGLGGFSLRAQSTAFTYQGFLTVNGAPANAANDFTFKLFNAPAGGSQSGPTVQTNGIGVTNGMFAAWLDFGGAAFNGADLWLEIATRPTGAAAFTNLTPRQPITTTPYAIRAASAGGAISNAQLAGTYGNALSFSNAANFFAGNGAGLTNLTVGSLASGQVVKSVNGLTDALTLAAGAGVTITPAGNSLQISAGSTGGMGWQIVTNNAVQAPPNTGFFLTNDDLVTLTLPASPAPGDMMRIWELGKGHLKLVQNPGQSIVAKDFPFSIGSAWIPRDENRAWASLACSALGDYVVAGTIGSYFFLSGNWGQSWGAVVPIPIGNWVSIAISADATRMVAAAYSGRISLSANGGGTWSLGETNYRLWQAVASSADGMKLAGAVRDGTIFTSTDSGAT
ncbi:MAG: hypothetical protein HY301_19525 [Verrucomicrobia bacterium]|nr:hypothetical protein [Verrucomicrobiota bacterium]